MMIEGSGSVSRAGTGSRSIPLTSGTGSRSGRPKNMWIWWIQIWIRIRNTGFNKHTKQRTLSAQKMKVVLHRQATDKKQF
jgi:hypothetical protein